MLLLSDLDGARNTRCGSGKEIFEFCGGQQTRIDERRW
jgi:hypothetical protein